MEREAAAELLALAREARLTGPEAGRWRDRLEPRRGELAEAVEALEPEAAVELAAAVWRLWLLSGDVEGGRAFLARALARDGEEATRARALALYADGLLAFRQGAQEDSQRRNEEALAAARAAGDPEVEAFALVGLSRVAFRAGDYARTGELAQQARALARGLDLPAEVAPLHMQAAGTRLAGDHEAAAALYRESLELSRRLGDRSMVAAELHNLGHVELHRGDPAAAGACFREAAELRDAANPYDTAMQALNDAALAHARGEREQAARLLDRCERTLADAGIALDPDDAFEVEFLRARLR